MRILKNVLHDYLTRMQYASGTNDDKATFKILEEMKSDLRISPPQPSDVITLLEEVEENASLPFASLVFVSAWYNLSPLYVPLLCRIVLSPAMSDWHEPAIELLGELPNSTAVDALKAAVDYRWDYDVFLCVPTKALEALSNIGTIEAVEVITQASKSTDQIISETARCLLRNYPNLLTSEDESDLS